ncbi:MAG: SLBB domain-containing protein [Desulfobacteraceae bacterium]|nr:SLBB domain-containing protein [Desulfobacteraceae bacterium]
METRVLLKNRKPDRILDLDEYRASGGYTAAEEMLQTGRPADVQEVLEAAGLLGRGGAAFPMGVKLSTVAEDAPFPRYLVCNADEMEPGTFKDRVLIHTSPHLLIEGMLLAAFSVRAEHGIIFIRPEYENAARILEREAALAREHGLLGKNIFSSGFNFDIVVHRSGGRYICGEGTALLNALEGKRPNPRKPPPYPTVRGLWQLPTVVQNVETLCFVPHVVQNGAEWFRNLATGPDEAGTKIFSVSGRVRRPGCYELPMGTALSEIIETHAGGMAGDGRFKACLPGGASTGYMPESMYHQEMGYKGLSDAGFRLGTAAVMVFDHSACLVGATVNLLAFFARESCGWCTPCREGLPYMHDLLRRIENGQGRAEFVPMLREMAGQMGLAYCAFAPGAAAPVESLITYFEDELREHIETRRCPFETRGPIAGATK